MVEELPVIVCLYASFQCLMLHVCFGEVGESVGQPVMRIVAFKVPCSV